MSEEIKLCPYCAEEIKVAAIVCKHCNRDIHLDGNGNLPDIRKARKTLDMLSSPGNLLVAYFIGAVIMNFLDFTGSAYAIYFGFLFVICLIANSIRGSLLTEEEKEAEDDYHNWLSGQRGP